MRAPLEREVATDYPNVPFYRLIFISKYRDNSILRDEHPRGSCRPGRRALGSALEAAETPPHSLFRLLRRSGRSTVRIYWTLKGIAVCDYVGGFVAAERLRAERPGIAPSHAFPETGISISSYLGRSIPGPFQRVVLRRPLMGFFK